MENNQQTTLKTKSRKRLFNEVVEITKLEVELKKDRARVIFVTAEHGNITYKLVKQIETSSFSEALGVNIKEFKDEPVTMANLNESLPTIIKLMSEEIKKNKKAICHMTLSESVIEDNNGEEQTYRYMFKGDIETIYCENIHKDDVSNIDKQLEREENYKNKYKTEI